MDRACSNIFYSHWKYVWGLGPTKLSWPKDRAQDQQGQKSYGNQIIFSLWNLIDFLWKGHELNNIFWFHWKSAWGLGPTKLGWPKDQDPGQTSYGNISMLSVAPQLARSGAAAKMPGFIKGNCLEEGSQWTSTKYTGSWQSYLLLTAVWWGVLDCSHCSGVKCSKDQCLIQSLVGNIYVALWDPDSTEF